MRPVWSRKEIGKEECKYWLVKMLRKKEAGSGADVFEFSFEAFLARKPFQVVPHSIHRFKHSGAQDTSTHITVWSTDSSGKEACDIMVVFAPGLALYLRCLSFQLLGLLVPASQPLSTYSRCRTLSGKHCKCIEKFKLRTASILFKPVRKIVVAR